MSDKKEIDMNFTISPLGGKLVQKLLPDDWEKDADGIVIHTDNWQESDIEMISIGGFSPLEGFMSFKDYESVLNNMHTGDGIPWTIPIVFGVNEDTLKRIKNKKRVYLNSCNGDKIIGYMNIIEFFKRDREKEALSVYKTNDQSHPGVAYLMKSGEYAIAGEIMAIRRKDRPFQKYRLIPAETRGYFKEKGWRTVVGFQTRNPIHRAHEYIQKCALEIVDGLFIHPIVGETKEGDIPADVRMKCYEELIKNYYPENRVLLCVNPSAMRYAGPKEAIFHAIIRRNYGCTHFIVGRDHAGVGNFYGPYDAQKIFSEFKGELGITPIFFENAFYCKKCRNMASRKTCPHTGDDILNLSGTKVREILSDGGDLPLEFTRFEIAEILRGFYGKTN